MSACALAAFGGAAHGLRMQADDINARIRAIAEKKKADKAAMNALI